jgi:hypothetical protein
MADRTVALLHDPGAATDAFSVVTGNGLWQWRNRRAPHQRKGNHQTCDG